MLRQACHRAATVRELVVRSHHSLSLIAAISLLFPAASFCQDETAAGKAQGQEAAALRAAVEHQSSRIDELAREVAHLAAVIEKKEAAMPEATGGEAPAPAAEPEVRKAETAPSTPTHVVAKGETLTSIAREYKVGVGELLQANKIVNDRRLQIGQTLVIPAKTENTEPQQKPTGGN
jgi:LysM repeat protein